MTKKANEDANFITIGSRRIPVEVRQVPIDELRYYEDNPRIYSLVAGAGAHGDQAKIESLLWDLDTTKELFQGVKANRGLIEEIVVRAGEVLEGNRRLCVYRKLRDTSKDEQERAFWSKILAKVVLEPITKEEVFRYLATLHVKGKAEWKPFEQAGFIYRNRHELGKTPEEIAKMIHLTRSAVSQNLKAYELMVKEGIEDPTRFSYFLEYEKRQDFSKLRAKDPGVEKVVVDLIKTNRIPRAEDIRRLPAILGDKKASKEFLTGRNEFDDALVVAHKRNPEQVDTFYRKLGVTRNALRDAPIVQIVEDIRNDHTKRSKIDYFLKEVRNFAKAIQWEKWK